MSFEYVRPDKIEARSFEIIRKELKEKNLGPNDVNKIQDAAFEQILVRVIHTSADFDYAQNLFAKDNALVAAAKALRSGAVIITDTNMAKSGIDKTRLAKFQGDVHCYISDEDIAYNAKYYGITRASASMEKAATIMNMEKRAVIFAIGNAPTALIRVVELAKSGVITPALVIGVPVGFVNVVESKEMLISSGLPHITARGRKGGSNVAAAICNALLRIAQEM